MKFLRKTMKNVRKHGDIKQKEEETNSVSEPNYHTAKFFAENLLPVETKKTRDSCEKTCPFRTFNTRIK